MKTAMAIIATFAASVALAVDVSTVEELTNALANASSGTEIVIVLESPDFGRAERDVITQTVLIQI